MDREAESERRAAHQGERPPRPSQETRPCRKAPDSAPPHSLGKRATRRPLLVLVSYSDLWTSRPSTTRTPTSPTCSTNREFSEWGGTGSARDYFLESSGGQFRPEFDVYGPREAPQRMSYYGANDVWGNDQKRTYDGHTRMRGGGGGGGPLTTMLTSLQYDRDGDGLIDNVFVFYAGLGEASGGAANTVCPIPSTCAMPTTTPTSSPACGSGHYACTNEWVDNRPDGCGTFIHEFSHVMGLPTSSATTYTSSFTPANGTCSTTAPDSTTNNGRTPRPALFRLRTLRHGLDDTRPDHDVAGRTSPFRP